MSAELLIQTLKGFGEAQAVLRAVLHSATDRVYVYYICPLTNLRGIVAHGILPNATAPSNRADLSSQGVQAKRGSEIWLCGWKQPKLHECINLFWNPSNLTMRAFQRNGLLLEAVSNNPDDAVICVLEIDLERLLESQCGWTIAPQNFARIEFTSFSPEQFTGAATWPDGTPKFDWKSVFSVASDSDDDLDWLELTRLNGKRSAELIVHFGFAGASAALPFEIVERIILPPDDIRKINQEQLSFLLSTGKPSSRISAPSLFYPKDELLKAEMEFVKSLSYRRKSDVKVLDKLNAALRDLEQFESVRPEVCPSRELYLYPELSDGRHGSLHAVRVMFWSAFLLQHQNENTKRELLPAVLTAAALHDTCRDGNAVDEIHGRLAAEHHKPKIATFLTDPLLAQCLNAIHYHCLPDEQCPAPDLVQQILKDADALDRGRFAAPNYEGGCNVTLFRTEALRLDRYNNIAWMAFRAAQITRHSPVGAKPCADFTRSLSTAVNCLTHKRSP
ncbi:MAG TPA: DarT ssDNA thymidine ADP-ribosyltransferase family protein [Candidatus Acidoferrales bacterium]|nr:DarT ssDNA thymidine ADP-ribosyltransferase family protein [Candidatus Acidoferrales bacterium]